MGKARYSNTTSVREMQFPTATSVLLRNSVFFAYLFCCYFVFFSMKIPAAVLSYKAIPQP